jgi:hypothetical protein
VNPAASGRVHCLRHQPGLRILIAEDNPVNQKVACGILEREGHSLLSRATAWKRPEPWKADRST